MDVLLNDCWGPHKGCLGAAWGSQNSGWKPLITGEKVDSIPLVIYNWNCYNFKWDKYHFFNPFIDTFLLYMVKQTVMAEFLKAALQMKSTNLSHKRPRSVLSRNNCCNNASSSVVIRTSCVRNGRVQLRFWQKMNRFVTVLQKIVTVLQKIEKIVLHNRKVLNCMLVKALTHHSFDYSLHGNT